MTEVKENKKDNSKQQQKPDFVKWFSELNKDSGKISGGKGANLAEIYNLKIPVPPGFVVTAQAYDYFIEKAGIKEKIKKLLLKIDYENTKQLDEVTKEIRDLIVNSKFPKEMEEEILESYENLNVKEDDFRKNASVVDILKTAKEPMFVAVRSSATTEDLAEASFAGQQDSFVNIKGNEQLIVHIKKCFASLFTSRATYYRNKKKFVHEDASLAVVIQEMVDSTKSGVIFSKDPTFKKDDIIIEAVWGLGEGIVSGQITPDKYTISKELEILDKKISDKKIAITRNSSGEKTIIKLREEKSKHQTLKDYEIKKLSEIALKLEEHYQKPQDIEFAIEGENIFIVQTRPITTLEKRIEKNGKELEGEIVLTGLGASPGIAVGKIKIINTMEDLQKITQGDVLVTKMTNPDMVVSMQKSVAIVTDEGGMTAHAAIVSREMGIPSVVGTREATTKLKDGEIITVDGSTGKIYKGKVAETKKKEVLPVAAETKTEIKVIVDLPSFAERASKTNLKKTGLTRLEGIIAESGKHPEYFLKEKRMKDYEEIIFKGVSDIGKYFDEIWVRTSDIRSDEFKNLKGAPKKDEANPMLGMHGIRYGIKNPEILKAELRALKKVSEQEKIIGLLLPQVISVEEVKKVKEILKEIDFEKARVGVMVETPAAVQIIRELCDEGIDFISFGTNDLTQYMLAVDRGNREVQHLYDELNPAILYQLEYVIRVCKRNKVETSICGQAGSKKEMVKFLIEKGIDSITVNADAAKEISDYVLELENKLTKGTDKEPRNYQPEKKENLKEEPIPPERINEDPPQKVEKENKQEEQISKESPQKHLPKIENINNSEEQTDETELANKKEKPIEKESTEEEKNKKDYYEENKEKINEDIEAIEEEKEEYLKEHPNEKFDEEPEFKEEVSKNKEKTMDIF